MCLCEGVCRGTEKYSKTDYQPMSSLLGRKGLTLQSGSWLWWYNSFILKNASVTDLVYIQYLIISITVAIYVLFVFRASHCHCIVTLSSVFIVMSMGGWGGRKAGADRWWWCHHRATPQGNSSALRPFLLSQPIHSCFCLSASLTCSAAPPLWLQALPASFLTHANKPQTHL